MIFGILGTAGLAACSARAAAQAASDHAGTLRALRAAGALDPYLNEILGELATELGRLMQIPGGAAVNAVPAAGGILVCTVRAGSPQSIIGSDVVLQRGSPVTDAARHVVWIDADFLRDLTTRISLLADPSMGGEGLSAVAVEAQMVLTPPPARPELWQPDTSPALTNFTGQRAWRGAIGFILAHEFGHVLQGPTRQLPREPGNLPPRARELAPVCPALTDPVVTARRVYEEKADELAFEAVIAGGAVLGRGSRYLAGDLGIPMLLQLFLAKDIVYVGSKIDSQPAIDFLRQQIGEDALTRLKVIPRSLRRSALIEQFYSQTHPAVVQRLSAIRRKLSVQPGSIWYGSRVPPVEQIMKEIADKACAEAPAR